MRSDTPRNRRLVGALALTMSMLAATATVAEPAAGGGERVPQVATITVTEEASLIRQLIGVVIAPQAQTLSSQVAGVVVSDGLRMGHRVNKGDVIVQLDDREAQAQHALAQAELAGAKLRWSQKQAAFERAQQTHRKKLLSQAEFDVAELEARQAESDMLVFQARSRLAELAVEKHRVVAPFNGVLASNSPVVGGQLLPGDALVELVSIDYLSLRVFLSHKELNTLKRGAARLLLKSDHSVPLALLQASPATSRDSGMIEAEFALPSGLEMPRFTASMREEASALDVAEEALFYVGQALSLQLVDDHLSVPEQAIARDEAGEYVFAVLDQKVIRVPSHRLSVGQQVVVLGPDNLRPGDSVSVLEVGELR